LHEFANSPATLSEMACPHQKVFYSLDTQWIKQAELAITNFLVNNINSSIFISLDVDVLESSAMSAVSAVNHNGMNISQLEFIMSMLKYHAPQAKLGIYEYNPLYEDLSNKGAKLIAHVLFNWFK